VTTDGVSVRTLAAATLGRYLVAPAGGSAPLLVGFHGYGENADSHLAELQRIPGTEGWSKVAVQALHRFYNVKTQQVVGSWMTRLDREQAIRDNLAYVSSVVAAVRREHATDDTLVFAGFSQGASMAWRAAAADPGCRGVIALGGDVPPDVASAPDVRLPVALIGRGLSDAWYTADKLAADLEALEGRAAAIECCNFAGGHEWTEAFRERASRFLAGIAK
jgi:dienelactone hydrolase